ncbi:unnamed protein product [Rhizoctonia solani]|uniref:BTB domain-containing protein n=1 Tax=Rhizoctonia solani TaxID=456999 RepID=A0A8H2XTS9_9AGAM|nr:unnamed protein product [Rhizoctonia solani]
MPSLELSEAELVSLGNNRGDKPEAEPTLHLQKANEVHPEFAFEDANIELHTPDQIFWVHQFQLTKFAKIGKLIHAARKADSVSASDNRIKIVCDGESVDFYNAFRVMYAPAILGVPEFQVDTLISALRIASTYDYADLRNFAIDELEKCSLPAIDQIELSDEFFLPHWEKSAFVDLCYRPEPITSSEARILGIERFAQLARIREAQQCHRLMELFNKSVQPHYLLAQMEGLDKTSALRRDAEFSSRHATLPQCDCKVHKNEAEFSSRHATLPQCDCKVHKNEAGARLLIPCQIHNLAPVILKESRTLFEQRNELLDRFASLNKAVAAEKLALPAPVILKESRTLFEQRNELLDRFASLNKAVAAEKLALPEEMKIVSVESELNGAPWIRRASSQNGTVM